MAIITVTTLDDAVVAPDGQVSLREALQAANTDTSIDGSTAGSGTDTIVFAPTLNGTLTLAQGELTISSNVTIGGDTNGNGAADITVDGNDASRVFHVTGGTATLDALVITGGRALLGGPGRYGGGVFVATGADVTITNSAVTDNTAVNGGGGIFSRGTLTLANVTVSENDGQLGGGIGGSSGGTTTTLTNVTVWGNSALYGGGILLFDGTATLTNTTVSGNYASRDGGGIDNAAQTTFVNSIVAGNRVGRNAPDIYISFSGTNTFVGVNVIGVGTDSDATDHVINTPTLGDLFAQVAPNAIGVTSGVLADNGGPVQTIAIRQGGTAHDKGDTAVLPASDPQDLDHDGVTAEPLPVDARGAQRVTNGTVDIGAFEAQPTPQPLVVTTLADEAYDGGDVFAETADGELSLREALGLANASPDANTITFDISLAAGTLVLTGGQLRITTDGVSVNGDIDGDGTADIAISGNNASRVFLIDDGDAAATISAGLNGLLIQDGSAAASGGGIFVSIADALTLTNSSMSGNSAGFAGGGISLSRNAALTLINATLSDNSAARSGGGIYGANDSVITLTNATVSGNSADVNGGGISGRFDVAITLTNSTVSGNSADFNGGGIYGAVGNLITLINSTVTGNSAGALAGGIYNYGAAGVTTLTNSIVAGNAALGADDDLFGGTVPSYLSFTGGNIIGSAPVSFVDVTGTYILIDGANQADLETVFAAVANDPDTGVLAGVLADNGGPVQTVAIRTGGVAHNAGHTAALPATDSQDLDHDGITAEPLPVDARGVTRVLGSTVDIGAFELNSAPTQGANTGLTLHEGDSATIVGAQLDFNDAEQADTDIAYTVTAATANGTLFLSGNPLGVGGTFTQDDIASNRVTYTHDGSETIADSFGFDVSDGAGGTVPGQTFAFTVNPVNDQAGGAAGGSIQYIEDQVPTALDPALTVTDPDSTDLVGARIAITGNFAAGQDVLAFTPQSGITGSYDAATGVLTLTGMATLAQYQGALRSVTYHNTSQNPSDAPRTVSLEVDDGSGLALMGSVGVDVIPLLDPPNDINGDQTSDIVWRNDLGTVDLWTMDGVAVIANQAITTLPNYWQIVDANGDYNGDGRSDLLWRDDAGTVVLWTMDGPAILSNTPVAGPTAAIGTIPDYWHIADTGDFTGDGRADILWRDDAGRVVLWEMNGADIVANTLVADVPTTSQIQDTADLTGDGMNDILWRDEDGTIRLWEMNGATVAADTAIGVLPDHWQFADTGDFNGDTRFDILWRDTAGTVVMWEMDGATVIGNTALGTLPDHWHIIDTGDYTGDLDHDILWRDTTGTIVLWEMDGPAILDDSAVNTVATTWHIVA